METSATSTAIDSDYLPQPPEQATPVACIGASTSHVSPMAGFALLTPAAQLLNRSGRTCQALDRRAFVQHVHRRP